MDIQYPRHCQLHFVRCWPLEICVPVFRRRHRHQEHALGKQRVAHRAYHPQKEAVRLGRYNHHYFIFYCMLPGLLRPLVLGRCFV